MEAVATILEVEVVAVQELAVAPTQALQVLVDQEVVAQDLEVAQDTAAAEAVLDQVVAQDTAAQDLEVAQDPIVVEAVTQDQIHQVQLFQKKKQKA